MILRAKVSFVKTQPEFVPALDTSCISNPKRCFPALCKVRMSVSAWSSLPAFLRFVKATRFPRLIFTD